MSLIATSSSTLALATSSSDSKPASVRRLAVPSLAIGIARPISARRSPMSLEPAIESTMLRAETSPMRS